jgi:uncharacterized protein YneF (UPF0154 family)
MQMTTENTKSSMNKDAVKAELWRRGNLYWRCHTVQKEMYEIFHKAPKHSTMVWVLARQSGKTFLLSLLALEQAIRQPNSIIKFVTDTKLHAETILLPVFEEILRDCPEDVKPEYKVKQYTFFFPNGSQVQLAGTDSGHYKRLRGQKCHLVLIDEAGFCNDLDDVYGGALFPTTTHTGGRIVMASSIPEQLDHEFFGYIEKAQFNGRLTEKTIDDNPLLTKEQIEAIALSMGGRDSLRFRREYLNEIVKDSNTSVIPEFTKELEKEIVQPWTRPPFYDYYVSMDIGGKDLTVVLFGYYDFVKSKLIIEDEIKFDFQIPGNNLELLTKQIMQKEKELLYNEDINEQRIPFKRVSDINPIAIGEILKYSKQNGGNLFFSDAKKDDKDSAINDLRVRLGSKQVIINPRCKVLPLHLTNVRWNSPTNKEKFARSPDMGHYDAVDALKYMVRSVQFNKNPYPAHYNVNREDLFIANEKNYNRENPIEIYHALFNSAKNKKKRMF